MARVLTIGGSPSKASRTALLLRHVGARLSREGGHEVRHLAVRELPAEPLLAADTAHAAIAGAVEEVAEADAVVVGTPVYKAAYSGLLKAFLDLLPQTALTGKQVLPLATGGSTAHVLALDYALRPVLTSLGSEQVLRGWFVLDRHLIRDDADAGSGNSSAAAGSPAPGAGGAGPGGEVAGVTLDPAAASGVEQAVAQLTTALATRPVTTIAA